jgi:hypothetical protein
MDQLLKHAAAALIISVACASASAQEARSAAREADLIGEWRGVLVKTPLDTQLALSMFRDGSYVRRTVKVSEFAWASEPRAVNITPIMRNGNDIVLGRATVVRMTVTPMSLTTRSGNDSVVLYRLGESASDSSLVGRWLGENAKGEEVIEEFAPDGKLLVMVTITRDAGRFSLTSHGEIEWLQQIPPEGKQRQKFKLEGNKLKLFTEPDEDFRGYPWPTRQTMELTRGPIQPQ